MPLVVFQLCPTKQIYIQVGSKYICNLAVETFEGPRSMTINARWTYLLVGDVPTSAVEGINIIMIMTQEVSTIFIHFQLSRCFSTAEDCFLLNYSTAHFQEPCTP